MQMLHLECLWHLNHPVSSVTGMAKLPFLTITLSMGYKRHFYERQNEQLVENSEKTRDRTSLVLRP